MAAKTTSQDIETPVPQPEDASMNVDQYLAKHTMDKKLSDMFSSMYRGSIAKESEWSEQISAVLGRAM